MGHDVGAPLEGAAVDGGREGVVHYQGYAVAVRDACEFLDVEHRAAGIADGLSEDGLGVGPDRSLDLLVGGVLVDEAALDAELAQSHGEEVVGASVDFGRGDEVVAGAADVQNREEVGRLAGRSQHRSDSALQFGYLGGHAVVGGVLEPRVEISVLLEVEEHGHLLAGVVLEGRALDYGEDSRASVLRLPAALYADGGGFMLILLVHLLRFTTC